MNDQSDWNTHRDAMADNYYDCYVEDRNDNEDDNEYNEDEDDEDN